MHLLDHEKLKVYQISISFVVLIDEIVKLLPKGKGYLADQFQRAALSVSLNIAEGAGEFSINEKIRFYRMAKRSSIECAGIFDICFRLQLIEEEKYNRGRKLLIEIASMLTAMTKGQGQGQG